MSGSIFLLAFFVAIATIVLAFTFERYCKDDDIVILTVCIGTAMTLSILVMSTLFTSVKHIQAYLKYDHVVVYDVYKSMPQIDKEKIIYRNDYVDARNNPHSYIIVAWNDEDAKNVSYDDLVNVKK